jgi:hypothetical protein
MSKSNYSYEVNKELKRLEIIDHCGGNSMSVTNNAENVLTEIQKTEDIKKLRVVYRDTDSNWDTLIPTWKDGECININFKIGVK